MRIKSWNLVKFLHKEVNMKRFFAGLLALVFAFPLFAQYGKIAGRVMSTEGEPIPAAMVRIVSGPAKGGTYADQNGYYVLLRLPPGTYTLEAKAIGYKPQVIKNVVVDADHTTEINFRLPSEAIEVEAVVVEAKEKIIKKDETESKAVVKGENLQNIPVASLEQAISLSSGVRVSGGVIQVRGGRPGEVSYVVDGVEVTDPYTGYQSVDLPLNAIQEASVSKGGFGAEYGSASSGVIQVATKEGTDKYEASLQIFSSLGTGGFFNTNVGDPYMKYFQPPYFYGGDKYKLSDGNTGSEYWNFLMEFDKNRAEIYQNNLAEFSSKDPYFLGFGTYFVGKDYFKYPWRENYFRPIVGIGGPILPFYDALRFYISYDFTRSDGTYQNGMRKEGSYQFKLSWFVTPKLKLFFGGVGTDGEYAFGFSPNWRLLLARMPVIRSKNRQFATGLNFAPSAKSYLELRLGYFNTYRLYLPFIDIDMDGVADFTDRDGDLLVEVDPDMLRLIGQALDPNLIHDTTQYWVELKTFWWETAPQGYFPVFAKGTKRQNYFLAVVKGTNDTVLVALGDTLYDFEGNAVELDTVVNIKDCYVPAEATVRACTTRMVFSNIYTPEPYTWPRLVFYTRNTKTWSARMDFLSQDPLGLKGHEFKTGFEFYRYDIKQTDIYYASGGNIYVDLVDAQPLKGAYYIRDKMEFEGFVANVGFRFDYYDPNAWIPSDLLNPIKNLTLAQIGPIYTRDSSWWYSDRTLRDTFFIRDPKRVSPTFYVSPRIGISHPISETDVLHFTYGHYFQIPRLRWLFANQYWFFTGAFNVMGNPSLKPEKTISYEVGIKHAFNPYTVIDITAFYKDIADLVQSKWIYIGNTGWQYTTFVNQDFGSVRGVEVTFSKTPGGSNPYLRFLTLNVAYTLQFAKASFANQYALYRLTWAGIAPEYAEEHYTDWDQRHVVNAVISYDVPLVRKSFNLQVLTGYGVALIYSYGTGTPWSPPLRSPRDVLERMNSLRMPAVHNVDLRLYKSFGLPFGANLRLFADIYNLFNDRTVVSYADNNYYYYFGDPEGASKDPTVYKRGRLTRYGLQITWKQR
ncbi:MAG: TonB-dependent receptor [Thermotogae bacterium]|nr:TonB-dependent receptor [Thermotogota bacterium]